jgi:hypothetical protein
MKLFFYLLSIITIMALAGLFIFKQPNGQSWISVDEFLPDTQIIADKINTVTNKLHKVFENDTTEEDSTVKVYRWKDSNGNWNYSDKSEASTNSEEVVYDTKDIVVLPAFKPSTIESTNSNTERQSTNAAPTTLITSPNKALKLYKDANNVQKLMDGRQDKLSKIIENSTK